MKSWQFKLAWLVLFSFDVVGFRADWTEAGHAWSGA